MRRLFPAFATQCVLAMFCVGLCASDVVYQYAVQMPLAAGAATDAPISTAYLWVPPEAPRIRGLIIGGNVLTEPLLAAHPAVRRACAKAGLGIVLILPHFDATLSKPDPAGARLEQTLRDLAEVSGQREIAVAPWLPFGHSVGTVYASSLLAWKPERAFGCLTFKGGFAVQHGRKASDIAGIPILHVQGQFEEFGPGPSGALVGNETRETGWNTAASNLAIIRKDDPSVLLGLVVDVGSTHFALNDPVAEHIAEFIAAAAALRIPDWPADATAPPTLNAVPQSAGAFADAAPLAPAHPPAAADSFGGDKGAAQWHPTLALAERAQTLHLSVKGKKPQYVSLADASGKPIGVGTDMRLKTKAAWTGADIFTAKGAFWDSVPKRYPPPDDGVVGKAAGEVQLRVMAGPLEQTGPTTFRLTGDLRTGDRPFVLVFHPGDATYRRAEQPAFIDCGLGKAGKAPKGGAKPGAAQQITFALPAKIAAAQLPLALQATSSAGLSVSYHVDHGPAQVKDGKLVLADVPTSARGDLRVVVVASQVGSNVDPLVAPAQPVRVTVLITR